MGDGTPHIGIPWKTILRITVVGILLIGHVAVWTRVSHFIQESRRLDRLIAAETRIQSDLARERAKICNATDLERFARNHRMVKAPVNGYVIAIGSLPAPDSSDTTVASIQPSTPPAHVAGTASQVPTQASIWAYQAQHQPSRKLLTRAAMLVALATALYLVRLRLFRRRSRIPTHGVPHRDRFPLRHTQYLASRKKSPNPIDTARQYSYNVRTVEK